MSEACPTCREPLEPGAQFCTACGAQLTPGASAEAEAAAPVPIEDEVAPISTPTVRGRRAPAEPAPRRPCEQCGGVVADDLYCTQCGTKAPSERDHFREAPAEWVAGVCDRGIVHQRNEDAMALAADAATPGGAGPEAGGAVRAALVVCDGVSSSKDSDVASLAAARAARDVLRAPLSKGLGTPESMEGAARQAFVKAAESAQTAVVANTDPSSENPSSCTFVAATVDPVAGSAEAGAGDGAAQAWTVRFGAIGDSRAYHLPDVGESRLLTTDDSVAQELIAGGMPREQAETSPQAHAITRWLGTDAPDIVPEFGVVEVSGAGWLLVCSDGLWNYASEPQQLRALVDDFTANGRGAPPELALALVQWANQQGGRDNITVALARFGPLPPAATPPPAEAKAEAQTSAEASASADAAPPAAAPAAPAPPSPAPADVPPPPAGAPAPPPPAPTDAPPPPAPMDAPPPPRADPPPPPPASSTTPPPDPPPAPREPTPPHTTSVGDNASTPMGRAHVPDEEERHG